MADSKNNDASIIKHCLFNNDDDMLCWFKDNDILIVDRGVCILIKEYIFNLREVSRY